MVDRTTQLAQSVAEGLSRRGFLGRLGRGAGTAAACLAGMFLFLGDARAGKPPWGGGKPCYYDSDCPKGQFCGPHRRCMKLS
jgi:hypothetical protein